MVFKVSRWKGGGAQGGGLGPVLRKERGPDVGKSLWVALSSVPAKTLNSAPPS